MILFKNLTSNSLNAFLCEGIRAFTVKPHLEPGPSKELVILSYLPGVRTIVDTCDTIHQARMIILMSYDIWLERCDLEEI